MLAQTEGTPTWFGMEAGQVDSMFLKNWELARRRTENDNQIASAVSLTGTPVRDHVPSRTTLATRPPSAGCRGGAGAERGPR